MFFVRQGATHKIVIGPVVAVANGYVPVTNLSVATADEAEVILHDNGTVVDISGYTFAAITTADGYYHLTLQSGISGTVGHVTVVINDDSLCLPVKAEYTVVEEAVYDALYAASAIGYVANQPVDVNTIKTNPVVNAGTITFPTGATLASTTNITAGTIATVTTLTNLPAITANWLTATGIAADAITAAKLHADVTTELQTGLATSVEIAAVDGKIDTIDTNVDAILVDTGTTLDGKVDAILVDTGTDGVVVAAASKTGYALSAAGSAALTEGYAALGAAATLPQLLYEVRALLAEKSISTTTLTTKKLDGTTTAATYTLDSATTPAAITRAT